jgi:hypothetical protein
MHRNAVDEDGGAIKARSFLNFDKDDRVMMAQLSQVGGRRYLHLKKMVDYLFQNRNLTTPLPLTQWWGYGCWCIAHGENPLLAKRGLPADTIDSYVELVLNYESVLGGRHFFLFNYQTF